MQCTYVGGPNNEFSCELDIGHSCFHKAGGVTWEDDSFYEGCPSTNTFPDMGTLRCVLNKHTDSRPHENGTYRWSNEGFEALTLKVSEIFYSLQGEGARAGEPSIFIRLQGCSAKNACYAKGVVCDTEFESGKEMFLPELHAELLRVQKGFARDKIGASKGTDCQWIVWTGGEPLDQLTPEICRWFAEQGYKQALETSGVKKLDPELAQWFNHITVSPKVAEHVLAKNFGALAIKKQIKQRIVTELRYVRHSGQPGIPNPSLIADYYYLSPHSDGGEINKENLEHCLKLCLENPKWRLSVQQHKFWRVL